MFYFHPYLGKICNLTNIFRWVETTNQSYFEHYQHVFFSLHGRFLTCDMIRPNIIRVANWPKLGKTRKNTPKLWKAKFFPHSKRTSINRRFQVSPLHLHREVFFLPGDLEDFFCGGHEIPSNCQALNQHLGLPVPTAVAVREFPGFTWLSRSMI